MTRLAGRVGRHLVGAPMLLIPLLALTGCQLFAIAGHAFESVPAVYQLPEDQSVLVVVDDARHQLADPQLPDSIAAQINFNLKQNLNLKTIISVSKLRTLADRLGEQYATTPIISLGRNLHAGIVIYVDIQHIAMNPTQMIYQPKAQLAVKVLQTDPPRRLFPHPGPVQRDLTLGRLSYPVTASLPPTNVNADRLGAVQTLRRRLATRIARDVSQLFYDHRKPTETSLNPDQQN